MAKKIKRKNNKRHLRPPLSFIDESIYVLGILLSFITACLFAFLFSDINTIIAFGKPETVAYRPGLCYLFILPVTMYFEISVLCIFLMGWKSKKPIFGNKKYEYGKFPFREDCFPLFPLKAYINKKSPSQKNMIRKLFLLWCIVFLILASISPLSFFGRTALYADNSVEVINVFNKVTAVYTTDEFSHLTIEAAHHRGHKGTDYYRYEISISMYDGKDFLFTNRDFDYRLDETKDISLDKMLEIKNLFNANEITVKGTDLLDEIAVQLSLNKEQKNKLNELLSEK